MAATTPTAGWSTRRSRTASQNVRTAVTSAPAVTSSCVSLMGNPSRIGVWGVSLGGYYAPRVASGDERVQACIALAGPFTFADNWDNLPVLTREAFRVRSKSPDLDTARARAGELTMTGRAEVIRCPLLAVMGKLDRLIPWQQAQRLVDEAGGPAELLLLDKGNHGCANLAPFHRYLTADWAADKLGARPTARG